MHLVGATITFKQTCKPMYQYSITFKTNFWEESCIMWEYPADKFVEHEQYFNGIF